MGWCEENGKRPRAVQWRKIEYQWDAKGTADTVFDPSTPHELPANIFLWMIRLYGAGNNRTFDEEWQAIQAADDAAMKVLGETQKWNPVVSLSHAIAAKFSNHVRLATAGLDAS